MEVFPQYFIDRLQKQHADEFIQITDALNEAAPISRRINLKKLPSYSFGEKIPWTQFGEYLPNKPAYALDPLFHAGAFYSQEASSMSLELIVNELSKEKPLRRVLDLCAAPGGKSTHLLQLIPETSVLVSNEIVPKRFSILYENLVKWGYSNFIATNYRPQQLNRLGSIFDLVVIDAPCSGEGLFRKQPKWREKSNVDNCNLCAHRQNQILASAIKLVRPGGFLIYSTCTLNPAENIDQINYLIQDSTFESIEISSLENQGFVRVSAGEGIAYQAFPHRVNGEPFFIGCVKRKGESETLLGRTSRIMYDSIFTSPPQFSAKGPFDRHESDLYFLNDLQQEMSECLEVMALRHKIPCLGTYKKDIFIPNHFSAMSTSIEDYCSRIEVARETALSYLRHDQLSFTVPHKGWHLITFHQIGLGWIKYDGRRIINKYPMNWRLRLRK